MAKSFFEYLDEDLITFGKSAYPKNGNVVILAGGSGSGKSFVKDKLLGIEGKVFDIDMMKSLIIQSSGFLRKVDDEVERLYSWGKLPKRFDVFQMAKERTLMNDVDMINVIHNIVRYTKLDARIKASFYQDINTLPPEKLPNIIHDLTLRDYIQLIEITDDVLSLGYKKENIHIVWVVNDIKIAREQNQERGNKPGGRKLHDKIILMTHTGAARTMSDIISDSDSVRKYMDGKIVIAFNQRDVDVEIITTEKGSLSGTPTGEKNINIKNASYITIKEQGKAIDVSKIDNQVMEKILSYVPKDTFRIINDNN